MTSAAVEEARERGLFEAARDEQRRRRAASDAAAWIEYAPPGADGPMRLRRWQRHYVAQVQEIDRLLTTPDGAIHVWLFSAPSQEGKSEIMRRSLAWLGARGWSSAVVTYAGELAGEHSQAIRDYLRSDRGVSVWPHMLALRSDRPTPDAIAEGDAGSTRAHSFAVPVGSPGKRRPRIMALGRRGSITGRTLDVLWLDDMYQSGRDYDSRASRREVEAVVRTAVLPRLMSRGGHLVCGATRWGDGDVHALLRAWVEEARARGANIVLHDAEYPLRAVADSPDGRAPGEYLHAGWNPEREAAARSAYGRWAAAILDCKPAPTEGMAWKASHLSTRYQLPPEQQARACAITALAIDGATGEGGDYTVIQWWGWTGPYSYLLGQWRHNDEPYHVLRQRVIDLRDSLSPRPAAVLIEDASSGRQLGQELIRVIPGLERVKVSRSKRERWEAVQPQHAAGQVSLPEVRHAPWVADMIDRLVILAGEGDEVDDEADAMALALWWRVSSAIPTVQRTTLSALRGR